MPKHSRASDAKSIYATPGELFDRYSVASADPDNLQAVQNMVSGAIGSYLSFACKNGLLAESIIVGVGFKSSLFFSAFFDVAVKKENGLQATISSSFGTVSQIAISKIGEQALYRAIGQRVAGMAAQRILVCAGIALAPEVAVVAGAVGIAFMAWKGGDLVNGVVDKGFEKYDAFRKARRRRSDYPSNHDRNKPGTNPSIRNLDNSHPELQLLSNWLLWNDVTPYTIPSPLTQKYINSNFHRKKR